MKTLIENIIYVITAPFINLLVTIDESRRINEDGSWDKYWARKKL